MPHSQSGCGRCHTCRERLYLVLDDEEYCRKCATYRRYQAHGWARDLDEHEDFRECPTTGRLKIIDAMQKAKEPPSHV